MKTIPLNQAYDILSKCSAVLWEDLSARLVSIPTLSRMTGHEDNEFLYISGYYDGQAYGTTFAEGENRKVKVGEDCHMYLIDTEGGEIRLSVLFPAEDLYACLL